MGLLKSTGRTLGLPETTRRPANLQCSLVHMQQPQTEPSSQQLEVGVLWAYRVAASRHFFGLCPATRCSPASCPPWPWSRRVPRSPCSGRSPTQYRWRSLEEKPRGLETTGWCHDIIYVQNKGCRLNEGLMVWWFFSRYDGNVPSKLRRGRNLEFWLRT